MTVLIVIAICMYVYGWVEVGGAEGGARGEIRMGWGRG